MCSWGQVDIPAVEADSEDSLGYLDSSPLKAWMFSIVLFTKEFN